MLKPEAKPNRDNEAAEREDDLTCYDDIYWSGLDNAPDTPANTPRRHALQENVISPLQLR
jgi:hypothetical protein